MVKYRKNVCLFCNCETTEKQEGMDFFEINCPICGHYYVEYESRFFLENEYDFPKGARSMISHELKRRNDNNKEPVCIMKDDCYIVNNLHESIERKVLLDWRREIDSRTIESEWD